MSFFIYFLIGEMTIEQIIEQEQKVYTFEPKDFSDIIVHYGDVSFHLHALYLISMSEYFKALIKPNKHLCSHTDKCQLNPYDCIVLDSTYTYQIGGIHITPMQLDVFFSELYGAADGSGSSEKVVKENINDVIASVVISVDKEAEVYEVIVYNHWRTYTEYCELESSEYKCEITGTFKKIKSGVEIVELIPDDEIPSYMLADYFMVDKLMNHYAAHALAIIEYTSKFDLTGYIVLRMLNLADRYHWEKVRKNCITLLQKNVVIKDVYRPLVSKICTETMIDLIMDL